MIIPAVSRGRGAERGPLPQDCARQAPERTDKSSQKGTGRAPEGFQKGRGKGLHLPPSSSLPFLPPSTHHHLRSQFGTRPTRTVSFVETPVVVPWSTNGSALWRRRERRLRAWEEHERLTVVMAPAETLHHSAQKWWSNTSSHRNSVTGGSGGRPDCLMALP